MSESCHLIYNHIANLRGLKGTVKEKKEALKAFKAALKVQDIDELLLPYLVEFNRSKYLYTVASCQGGGNLRQEEGHQERAYIVFRSLVPLEFTIKNLILPILEGQNRCTTEYSLYMPQHDAVGFNLEFNPYELDHTLDVFVEGLAFFNKECDMYFGEDIKRQERECLV
jgi:hypothetical protein